MNVVRNVILQKKVLSVLVQVILLQSFACGMQIAEKTCENVSVNSELLKACVASDSSGIVSLLAEGADVNAKDKNGMMALHYAAYRGYKEIAELLLAKAANLNAKDRLGRTALYCAVVSNHKEIAKLLISKGADANTRDNNGMTALHAAALEGHKEIAELLIKNEADVNANDEEGVTALYVAALEGHKEIAELLIKNEADVNAKAKNGWTALHVAALEGHKEIAELLIAKGAKANTKDFIGSTALHLAAYKGHKETAELLIYNDAVVNAKIDNGQTALHFAMEAEDLETAQLLIMCNADRTAKDNQGQTPFQIARDKFKDALLAQALMRLLQKNKEIVLLTDLRLWLHTDYSIVEELQQLTEERKSLLCSTMQNKPLDVSSQTPALFPQESQIAAAEEGRVHFGEKYTREFNGLALDGEGLEALITASMVKKLEEELQCPMYQLFDCVVGTSFGGIVALGLVASKEGDDRLLDVDDLIKFFEKYDDGTLSKKLKIKNCADSLKQRLNALFKGSRLSDTLSRIFIPCKNVKQNKFFMFDSKEAQRRAGDDYYLRDIAAITAVDSEQKYFNAAHVQGKTEELMTASSIYRNRSAGLLVKVMNSDLDESQKKKFRVVYCAANGQDEGHKEIDDDLKKEYDLRYRCILPKMGVRPFDDASMLETYRDAGEKAVENFLDGSEGFVRQLKENRALRDTRAL